MADSWSDKKKQCTAVYEAAFPYPTSYHLCNHRERGWILCGLAR